MHYRPGPRAASLEGVMTAFAAAQEHQAFGFLHVYEGANAGMTLLIGRDPVRIGRGSGRGALVLHDPAISSAHCRVLPTARGLELVDLGSTNGTYVNDVRVPEHGPLRNGDVLAIGDTRVYVGVVSAATTTPAASSPAARDGG